MMRALRLLLLGALALGMAPSLAAQHFGVEVLGTAEAWKTDTGSRLLARNGGNPDGYGDVNLWLQYQPAQSFRILAIAEAYGSLAHGSDGDAELVMLSARYWKSRALRLEAGKILLPLGEFASRRFSNINPLIGAPDTYVSEYPWGASLSGAIGRVDYGVAAVSLPAVNERYTPSPGFRFRPVVNAGITLSPGLRVGAALTHGAYLSDNVQAQLPAGFAWNSYLQTVATFDLRWSTGRIDTRGEMAVSSYGVPTVAAPVHGLGWYVESKLTLSPRVFVAARYEDNRYAFVLPVNPNFWVGTATTQMNGEAGVGYRLTSDALVKASVRKDHWPVHEISGTSFPDGYAVALQLSLHADILALLQRKP